MTATVGNISPLNAQLLSEDWQTARRTAVTFDLTVSAGLKPIIRVKYGEDPHAWPVVYDGTNFSPLFAANSTVTPVGDVYTFSLLPIGGWWRSFELIPGERRDAVSLADATDLLVDWKPPDFVSLDPLVAATYEWGCQETVGSSLAELNTESVDNALVAPVDVHYLGQTANGVMFLDSLTGRKAVECGGTSYAVGNRFQTIANILDAGAGSIACRVYYRRPSGQLGPNPTAHTLCGNWAGTSPSDGWRLVTDAAGDVELHIGDGTNAITLIDNSGEHDDGAWHWAEITIDHTLDQATLRTDTMDPASTIVTAAGSVVFADIGSSEFSLFGTGVAAHSGSTVNSQVTALAGWEGSTAEGLHLEDIYTVFAHGRDPARGETFENKLLLDGTGTVYTPLAGVRGKLFAPWGRASSPADVAQSQIPIGFDANLSARGSLNSYGLFTAPSKTNIVAESERLDVGWTVNNATVSAAYADVSDNPLGVRMSRLLTATAANGQARTPSIVTTPAQQHQCYCWVKGNGAAVAGRLIMYDITGVAEIASQVFSALDGVWTLVGFEAVAPSASTSVRVEIDVDTESIHVAHVTLIDEDRQWMQKSGIPVPAYGGLTGSAKDSSWGDDAVGSTVWNVAQGQIDLSFIPLNEDSFSNREVFTAEDTASGENDLRVGTSGAANDEIELDHADDAAVSVLADVTVTGADPQQGFRVRYSWKAAAADLTNDKTIRALIDHSAGQDVVEDATTWTTSDTVDGVRLGGSGLAADIAPMLIGSLRIFNLPEVV